MNPLTRNQDIFINEFLIDRNGTRAYLAAYPRVKNKNVAAVNANRLLRKAKIEAAIDKALERQAKRTGITADRVLQETAKIAFSDIGRLFDEHGNLKKLADMDPEDRTFLQNVETSRSIAGGSVTDVTKVKLWDKLNALEKLGKHFKLFTDRQELTGADGGPIKTEVTIKFVKPGERNENLN